MSKTVAILMLCGLALWAAACDSSSGAPGQTWQPPKLSIGLMAAWPDDRPLRFEESGREYEIEKFVVVVSAVEIHLCEVASGFWIRPAYAHVPSSATRLGTPVVDDVMRGGGFARIFGEITPPLGEYCEVWVVVTPADADVVNLTSVGLEDVVGKTAVAVGRVRDTGGEWREQVWSTALREVVRVDADFGLVEGGQEQLILTKELRADELVAPVEGVQADDIAARLLHNVMKTYRIYEANSP